MLDILAFCVFFLVIIFLIKKETLLYNFLQIELLDTVALNLHRIDKDVARCDRNYYYFTTSNLEKLRNIMCR